MQPTAALSQPVEQKHLRAREHRETRKAVEQCRGVAPIAGAVLQPDHGFRVGRDQAADEVERVADHRHRRDVIEKEPERRRSDLVDNAGDEREDAVVADPLVVEGRQHQHPAAAVTDRVPHQGRGVGHRAGAGPRHQLLGRDPRLDQPVEQCHPLGRATSSSPRSSCRRSRARPHPGRAASGRRRQSARHRVRRSA